MKQYMSLIRKSKITKVLIALFVVFGLSLSLNIVDISKTKDISGLQKSILKIEKSMQRDTLKSIIIFGFTYFLLRKKYKNSNNIFKIILAVLFSIFMVFGYSYAKTNSWDLIFKGKLQFIKSLIVMFSYYIIFKLMINYAFEYIVPKIKYKSTDNKVFNYIFEKHSCLLPLAIILICWLPYLIAYYPGLIMQDSREQIKQFYGIKAEGATNSVNLIDENVKITNHHPVFHTILLGSLIKIGSSIANDNFGVFLYTILQTILLASSFAYIINYMKELQTPNYIRILSLIIFAILPVFPFYAVKITKDTMFTALIIFYIVKLHQMIKKAERHEKYKISDGIKLAILFIIIALTRNNGIYNIILSFPLLALIDKTNRKKILIITIGIFCIYKAYTSALLPALKIAGSSPREMLSIPFQQTARYVTENEDKVTEEEKEKIDKVLIYDTLDERYNPVHADAVKNKFNKDATSEDLKEYLKVWFNQLTKSTDTYIQATINNIYGYFYPECKATSYIASYSIKHDKNLSEKGVLDYHYNNLEGFRRITDSNLKLLESLPIISLVINIGLNTWLILGMIGYICYKKKYRYIIFFVPSITILLVCIASPVNAYFRYAMPNLFAMPLIFSIFIDIIRGKEEKLNGKENCSNNTML